MANGRDLPGPFVAVATYLKRGAASTFRLVRPTNGIQRGVAVWMDLQQLREPRDLENVQHWFAYADQREPGATLLGDLASREESAQRRGVEMDNLVQVEHHVPRRRAQSSLEPAPELARCRHVDVARRNQQRQILALGWPALESEVGGSGHRDLVSEATRMETEVLRCRAGYRDPHEQRGTPTDPARGREPARRSGEAGGSAREPREARQRGGPARGRAAASAGRAHSPARGRRAPAAPAALALAHGEP